MVERSSWWSSCLKSVLQKDMRLSTEKESVGGVREVDGL